MKVNILSKNILIKFYESGKTKIMSYFLLSWLFAICSQIIIPLPFNFVPISLQPLPIFLTSLIFGWPAVWAYSLTIFQTALGAPFFSGFEGGLLKLLGPTGGYIFGWLLAAIFLTLVKDYRKNSFIFSILKLLIANIIMFSLGLFRLSFFVEPKKVFYLGLYPFIFGCLLKMVLVSLFVTKPLKN